MSDEDLSHLKTFRDVHAHVQRKLGWSEERIKHSNEFADALNPKAVKMLDAPIETVLKPGTDIRELVKALTLATMKLQHSFDKSSN